MVAEKEVMQKEGEPFPEPTPEERKLPLGKRGELAAARFLERKGYEILETNWTCVAGEADIIALEDDSLCFVEVKTRSNAEKGFPSEAVDAKNVSATNVSQRAISPLTKAAICEFALTLSPSWFCLDAVHFCVFTKMRLERNSHGVSFLFAAKRHHSRG